MWGTRVVVRGVVDLASSAKRGSLRDLITPYRHYESCAAIPWDEFANSGFKSVLFDLENTLIAPGGPWSDEGSSVIESVRRAGLECAVVSNCSSSWVQPELEAAGVPVVAPAGKPSRRGFERGCELIGADPGSTIYVGDQVVTDVLGSQMAGMKAVLVKPRWSAEQRSAKAQRLLVKAIHKIYGDPTK